MINNRKITFALTTIVSTTLLSLFNKVTGNNVVAIYCALISLFNIANAIEHKSKGKES